MDNVVVLDDHVDVVITEAAAPVEIITVGVQGPPGPVGGALIGGYSTEVSGISAGDLLAFSGARWVNVKRTDVSDGGNF